jgi:alanine racemase
MTTQTTTNSGVDDTIATHRITINAIALARNYRLLAARAAPARCAAVVKADGYGLGIEYIVPVLLAAGCDRFFVAYPQEGLAVRALAPKAEIFVLGGIFPEALPVLLEARLIPVLSAFEQIEPWARLQKERGVRLVSAIHVDTGMNRMGLSVAEATIFAQFNDRAGFIAPVLVMSHLACSDEPDHPLNRQQLEAFQQVAAAFPETESSLAASSGIFLGADYHFDMVRPGIALYGGNPTTGRPNPMTAVATCEARVLQVRDVAAGQPVSYGATAVTSRDSRIATVGVGYADGFHRASSGSGVPVRNVQATGGQGFIAGQRVPVIGRVTMDMTMFDVTDLPATAVKTGHWLELSGENIKLDDAAGAAGTISYEMLTSLGRRAARRLADS